MIEKQVFCRFVRKKVTLENENNDKIWVCGDENKCNYWNIKLKDEEVMIAPFCPKEPEIKTEREIELEPETKDVVIICRHLLAWRKNSGNNKT